MNNVTTMADREIMVSTDASALVEERLKLKALQKYFSEHKEKREQELDCNIGAVMCERRIGELESEREKDTGDPRCARLAQGGIAKEYGVSRREYQRWQARAAIPDETFAKLIDIARANDKPISGAQLDRLLPKKEPWSSGFKLQTTNQWRFDSSDKDPNGWDGGISRHLVANLLHYFTVPGDVVVDPMAGSGRTADVVSAMPYFQDDWAGDEAHDNGGARVVLMSDINPTRDDIAEADARESIPFDSADFIMLDPPYWKIAEDKYNISGQDIKEWVSGIEAIGANCKQALKPDGYVALVMDDYLRSKEKQPLPYLCAKAMERSGFKLEMTIYNSYHNASATMGALGQWRAKKARLMVSGMKVVNIFKLPH